MALITINRPVSYCNGEHDHPVATRSWWRRGGMLAVVLAVVAGTGIGTTVAFAGGGQNTTSVSFVSLNPAKKVLNGVTIAANKTASVVVIGSTTTVPSDATTVELSISATGTASGVLNIYPTGNLSGGSGQFVEWAAHGTGTATIQENPGQSGELTFYNVSSAAAKVTATIVGYSTQVTAGDVNGSGGTAGQALVNNGDGTASWGDPAPSSYTVITPFSTSLPGLAAHNFPQVAALNVPAGDFDVTYTATVSNTAATADTIYCYINGTAAADVGQIVEKTVVGPHASNEITLQAITRAASAGQLTVTCNDDTGTASVGGTGTPSEFPVMTAVQVNAHGVYSNN